MEQQQASDTSEQPRKEPLLSKSTMVIIAIFLVINLTIPLVFFLPKVFRAKPQIEGAGTIGPLDSITPIKIGRLEVTKAIDPMQQNFMRISVNITVTVPAERAAEIEPKIKKFEALLKEQARKAFLDADPRDIATENLAGVKNAIRSRFNELLGEDDVKDVVFEDFKPY